MMKALETRLRQVGSDRETWPIYGSVLWRGILLGTVLFFSLTDDSARNLRHNVICYIVAVIWCYYAGTFARHRWSAAGLEGLLLHLIGVAAANMLALAFGNSLIPG